MYFIVYVTDWHHGGHISFVCMIDGRDYKLISDKNFATHFTCIADFAITKKKLNPTKKRTIGYEFIVDHQLMKRLREL